jgi:hypothetical protein
MRGIVAIFPELDAAVEALQELKKRRLGDVTVYTPAPRHEFDEVTKAPPSVVRVYTLIGALLGTTFGYWIPIWISDYWPLVVGGKPIASWVPYTIIGFEIMVLIGSLATVLGLFITARIPRITQTVGYDPRFSDGSFGIWVECRADEQDAVRRVLRDRGAAEVRGER